MRKVYHGTQPFQGVALSRKLLQPVLNVEKSRLPCHRRPPHPHPGISRFVPKNNQFLEVSM
jgi:hypothetical protein